MHRQTNDVVADGEVVWSRPPDAEAKLASFDRRAGDGGKKARSPRRARRTPLKPLRREGRLFGQSRGNCRQLFYLLAGHGCGLHPAFPAPSHFWRDTCEASLGRDGAARTRTRTLLGCLTFKSEIILPCRTSRRRYTNFTLWLEKREMSE